MCGKLLAALPLLTVIACGTPTGANDLAGPNDLSAGGGDLAKSPDGMAADPQLPPVDSAASLEKWLATGTYKAWACEKDRHAARAGSGHTTNRICNNDKLSTSTSGEYPTGSASVKELFDGAGTIIGYAVGVRTQAGPSDASWFWYERINTSVYGNGPGVPLCAGCHRAAPRDFIYTQVTR